MKQASEGLRSDVLRAALQEALAGKPQRLELELKKQSRIPSPRPNIELAAAFGAEISALPGSLARLLTRWTNDGAAPEDPSVFLPVVAAHGWAGRIRGGHELLVAWAGLAELACDERSPVRLGTLDALLSLGVRDGGADTLLSEGLAWLQVQEGAARLSAAALLLEALGEPHVLATLDQSDALLDYVGQVIALIAEAPRAAERWEGRRRALMSLPRAIAQALVSLRAHERGLRWFESLAADARHPDVRAALSQSLGELRRGAHAPNAAVIEGLRQALEASAKPLRDAARVRPGTGRGRRSRETR